MRNLKKIIVVFSLLFSGYATAATVSMSNTSDVNINDIFTLDIVGSGFSSNVDGGGVNFAFNQNVLNVLSVNINETVWNFGSYGINTGNINNSTGTVDGIMVNTFANVTGYFVIATIEFQAIGLGNSGLSLSELAINPWASGGSLINPSYIDTSVAVVSAVPVPAAVWLFGSGLIALMGISKRKKMNV